MLFDGLWQLRVEEQCTEPSIRLRRPQPVPSVESVLAGNPDVKWISEASIAFFHRDKGWQWERSAN